MNKIVILGHENPDVDSIVSGYILEKIMVKKGYDVEFIIPDNFIEAETLDICLRNNINPLEFMKKVDFEDKSARYILVDHNERKLAGQIICVIDHHPTSKETKIKHYYNKKISSTALLICKGNEQFLELNDLKLVALATLVDTVSFHSTKSRKEDELWVREICEKFNIDYDFLYKEGLGLTSLNDLNCASLHGLKKYDFNGKKVESSYIQIGDIQKEKLNIDQIIDILKERVILKKLDGFVFIVFDMVKFQTDYYLIKSNKIYYNHVDEYISRGNDIMPKIEQFYLKKD